MTKTKTRELLGCSFCGKRQDAVEKLIAGPGVYICNDCVALCDGILANETQPDLRDWDESSDDDLLAEMVRIHGSHDQIDMAVSSIVQRLRARGVTWVRIGESLGMTRQSAWERFSGEE